MTPTAATPAARGKRRRTDAPTASSKSASSPGSSARVSRHSARPGRPGAAPAPRRVSGPAGGRAAARTAPARTAPSRKAPTRRTSGPVSQPARRGRARGAVRQPLKVRATQFVRGLPDHSLLDQIIRGRAWIPLLGVLLAGIVAMQVEVLKLSASVGRSLEHSTALQGRNDQLQASVAQLGDDQRIERLAAADGMVMPSPTAPTFLPSHVGSALTRALGNIHAPDASAYASVLPAVDQSATDAVSAGSTVMPGLPGGSTTSAGSSSPASTSSTDSGVPGTSEAATSPDSGSGTGTEGTGTSTGGTTTQSGVDPGGAATSGGTGSGPVAVTTTPTGG